MFHCCLKKELMGIYRFQTDQIEHFCSLYDKMPKSDKHFEEEGHHVVLLTVYATNLKLLFEEIHLANLYFLSGGLQKGNLYLYYS